MSIEDKVHKIRAHVDFEVTVISKDVTILAAHTIDISVSGMLIHSDALLPVGQECETLITLKATTPIILRMKGHVVRQIDKGFAISFDIMDEDSFMHLKKLVMYNTEAPNESAE